MKTIDKLLEPFRKLSEKRKEISEARKNFHRHIFKEEYKVITGCYRQAVLLNQLLFMHNLNPEWIRTNGSDLKESLHLNESGGTIRRDLRKMEEAGFLTTCKNPDTRDRGNYLYLYQVNEGFVQKKLIEAYPHLAASPTPENVPVTMPSQASTMPSQAGTMPSQAGTMPSQAGTMPSHIKEHKEVKEQHTSKDDVVVSSTASFKNLEEEDILLLKRVRTEVTGINEKISVDLLIKFGRQLVEKQLNLLKARIDHEASIGSQIRSVPAFFVKSVRQDWTPPASVKEPSGIAAESPEAQSLLEKGRKMAESLASGVKIKIGELSCTFLHITNNGVRVNAGDAFAVVDFIKFGQKCELVSA